MGSLWENFIISERKKYVEYKEIFCNTYFWRTHSQQEIDYIEERDGKLYAYEIKWSINKTHKLVFSFKNAYPDNSFKIITPENYLNTDFIMNV